MMKEKSTVAEWSMKLKCFRTFSSFPSLTAISAFYLPFSFPPNIGSLTSPHLSALPRRPHLEAVQHVCKKLVIHHFLQWLCWIKRLFLEGNTRDLLLSSVRPKTFCFRICCLLIFNFNNQKMSHFLRGQ